MASSPRTASPTGVLYSFRLRLALLFGGLSLLIGAGMLAYIEHAASARMTHSSGEELLGTTHAIAHAVSENLRERDREISLLAQSPLLANGPLDSASLRGFLAHTKHSYPYYAWLGIASPQGRVLIAAEGLLEGADVNARPWFAQGSKGAYIGDVHEAVLLAKHLAPPTPTAKGGEPLRFVDFAAPIRNPAGQLRGVLASHAHWYWVAAIIHNALPHNAEEQGIEPFISGTDGLLYPFDAIGKVQLPAALPTGEHVAIVDWPGSGSYLTASLDIVPATSANPGWRIVLRQPLNKALAPVFELRQALLALGMLATGVFMLLAYWLAVTFSRPLERLADAAHAIEQGQEDTSLVIPTRTRELNRLSDALRGMTLRLINRKRVLEELNASLESQVAARTAELTEANQALERLARQDALTGLHNRLACNEQLHQCFLRQRRSGAPYSVLLMDIDHFKQVNDQHGHEVGDHVLQHVAELLAKGARASDLVARFGGEEFLVLLPDTEHAGAGVLAEKIRQAVAGSAAPVVGRITLSIGVATSRAMAADADEIVRRADAALYRAKEAGRNRVESDAALPLV